MLKIIDHYGNFVANVDEDGTVLDEDLDPVVIDEEDSAHPRTKKPRKKKKKKSRTNR